MKNIVFIAVVMLMTISNGHAFNAFSNDANTYPNLEKSTTYNHDDDEDWGGQMKEHKVAHSTGKILVHDIDEVDIQGYDGNEVIFKARTASSKDDERAQGLKLINSAGLEDNTGLGIAVVKEGEDLKVQKVGKLVDDRVTIMLPKNMGVYYSHSTYNGDDVSITGIAGEIEISAVYNDIRLSDVTGPMAIKSVYGGIEANFSQLSQNGSVSLNSVYDHVDVTIPSSAAYDISARTPYGDIYSDVDIQVEKTGGMRSISSSKISGKVNGGGVEVILKSSYENIYLRKG